MRGLRIIPMFIGLIILSYFGMWFIEMNRVDVTLHLGSSVTPPAPLGFVVLTAILIGMLLAGVFCSIELLALYMQNRRLRSKIPTKSTPPAPSTPSDITQEAPRVTGRFT